MSRRLVTVLFLDLVDWTGLSERVDPEPLQLLLEQYYEICAAAVSEHGGEVEKYIGDAVMAVFGAAVSQEDDALRALRAAFGIRATVQRLVGPADAPSPDIHCGIAAGEALVSRSSFAGLRVVGDVVNLAARLQSAATAGQILVNETIAELARPYFSMTPMPPLTVKGKADPVPALLVTGPAEAADETGYRPGDGTRMVDRTVERARLREAYDRAVDQRRAGVLTVSGPLGIGKTRLIREVVDELAGPDGSPPVVVLGSCPFYGPAENQVALLQVLDGLVRDSAACGELLRGNERIAAVLASLRERGQSRTAAGGPGPGVEEVAWTARELLTAAATAGPLVVIWDNLGWAGRSLLRLIGDLQRQLVDLPLLMICAGRQEPAEQRAGWLDELAAGDAIDVGALGPDDSTQLAVELAVSGGLVEVTAHDVGLVERVTSYSAGNPLFIKLMLESTVPGGQPDDVPPTIKAVVGAMIDRLPSAAQELLGAASVIGPTFTLRQLGHLTESTAGLSELVDRQLVRPGAVDGEYAFVQQPVHEIAYGRLDKERRLAWHRRLTEHQVSPAFHLEAAVRLLGDLRPHDPELARLAGAAAAALLRDGTDALRQRDLLAAVDLLQRAHQHAMDSRADCLAVVALRLSDALTLCGETRRAMAVVSETADRLPERLRWPCVVQGQLLAARMGGIPDQAVADEAVAGEAVPQEEGMVQLALALERAAADRLSWCRFEQLRMVIRLRSGHFVLADRATCAALEHARALGDEYEQDWLLAALCEVRQWSPVPISDKLAVCAELVHRFADDRFLLAPVLAAQARNLALVGDQAGARAALVEAGAAVEQLQLTMGRVLTEQTAGLVCSVAGEHPVAEQHYRLATGVLERAGLVRDALTMRVLAARERSWHQPADATAELEALLARQAEMDLRGRLVCLSSIGRLAAAAGTRHPALAETRQLLADLDDPCMRGEAYFDLAQTHRLLGEDEPACEFAQAAIDSYAAVGATAPIRTVQAWR